MFRSLGLMALAVLALAPAAASAQHDGSRGGSVVCESNDGRYRECRVPFGGPAELVRQMSDTRCVEGRNWGSRPGLVWVDNGCRGRFEVARYNWPTWNDYRGQRQVVCESKDERYRQCNADFYGRARIVQQLSNSACIEGRSWGQSRGLIWVSRGCRARFEDTGWNNRPNNRPDGNYGETVTCYSTDNRRRACPWNPRWGRPYLVEQVSDSACIEGRSWGYGGDRIWVDNGCRGRFAARRYEPR